MLLSDARSRFGPFGLLCCSYETVGRRRESIKTEKRLTLILAEMNWCAVLRWAFLLLLEFSWVAHCPPNRTCRLIWALKVVLHDFPFLFWQLNWIITLLNKYSITLLNVLAFVSLFIEWILGCYLSTESSFVLSEPGRRLMKLRLLWQVKLIARFQYPLNRKVWKLFWLLQMEYEVWHAP